MPEADETGDVLMILSGVLGHREGSKVRKDRHLCRRPQERFSDPRPFPLASLLRLLKNHNSPLAARDRQGHAHWPSSRMGGPKSQN